MRFLGGLCLIVLAAGNAHAQSTEEMIRMAATTTPAPRQLAWQQCEFTCFIHFGVNTFTGREWGSGKEAPALFNPTDLDTDQWCRAMKAAGMKLVVFTAKHHDGFCLWPTRYTRHSVAASPWRDGQGDVLRDLSESCQKHGIKLGVYLSPADLYQIENPEGLYGNGSSYTQRTIPRPVAGRPFADKRTFTYGCDDYNEYFLNQLFELLTEYGPVHEVWFDGAHPKRKGGQTYTYHQWYDLIRTLAPEAVIAVKGPDVRWCGNEAGHTRPSEWSVIPIRGTPEEWRWPDMRGDDLGSLKRLQEVLGNGGFLRWYPAETNTSIRHGWFWRDERQVVKSVAEILDIWYRSVGGNTVFLLNVPPDNRGRFADRDVRVLETVGAILKDTFAVNLAADARVVVSSTRDTFAGANVLDGDPITSWMPAAEDAAHTLTLDLDGKQTFNRIVLQEQIRDYSQRIVRFAVDIQQGDSWEEIASDTVVGYKRICRIPAVSTDRVRVRILESRLNPTISEFGLYLEGPLVRVFRFWNPGLAP
jgi:alpha-L-fucosidase